MPCILQSENNVGSVGYPLPLLLQDTCCTPSWAGLGWGKAGQGLAQCEATPGHWPAPAPTLLDCSSHSCHC